ncbi:MAG: NapC/NirT family cytochrome c [Bacillota bacterium]|nr:NapC/NirT family cytochrome c [Bacillota bacterium]
MKYKITIIVALIGLVVVGAAAIKLTSQPSFCSSCHSISPLVESWETSSHQNVSCMSCHAEPGLVGLVKRKAYGLHELYVHVTNPEVVPKAQSDTWEFSQRCLDCHDDIRPGSDPQLSPLSHNKRHFELEMPCLTCHEGLVHREEQFDPLPSREVCLNCHGSTFE